MTAQTNCEVVAQRALRRPGRDSDEERGVSR